MPSCGVSIWYFTIESACTRSLHGLPNTVQQVSIGYPGAMEEPTFTDLLERDFSWPKIGDKLFSQGHSAVKGGGLGFA